LLHFKALLRLRKKNKETKERGMSDFGKDSPAVVFVPRKRVTYFIPIGNGVLVVGSGGGSGLIVGPREVVPGGTGVVAGGVGWLG
jgi:hypothetical protein